MKDRVKTKRELLEEFLALGSLFTEFEADKTLQKALQEKTARYKAIVEDRTELICIFLADRTITFANKALCNFFSFKSEEDVLGISFLDLIPKEERKAAEETISSLGAENPSGVIAHWVQIPSGEKRWQQWTVHAILKGEEVTEFQAVGRNESQLLREEELLSKSEEYAKELLDAPIGSAILMDINGRILAINKLGAMRFGMRKEELIGKDPSQYLPPELRGPRKSQFDKVIRTRKPVNFEDKRDGMVLDNHIYPLFDSKSRVSRFAVFSLDITEKKRVMDSLRETERVLKAKTKNLEEANIALEVLLRKREKDREELEDKVCFNVKQTVMPFLEKLKESGLNDRQKAWANIVESNLNDVISSFSKRLISEYSGFTPAEIQVANLIKQGKGKKEIAEMFNRSVRTIEFHGHNIRKKLDIKNKKISLKTYLLSLK